MNKWTYVICLTTMMVGCQKDRDNNPVANLTQAANDRDLQGKTFVSGCSSTPLEAIATGLLSGGSSSLKSEFVSYRFDGANVIRQTHLFNSSDCSGDTAITFEEAGTMDIETDPNKKTSQGARNIDLDYKSLKASVSTAPGVTAANSIKLCGAADWMLNQSRDVQPQSQDATCYGAQVPRHVGNIYRLGSGTTLYFGTVTTGAVPDTQRPTILDMTDKYTAK